MILGSKPTDAREKNGLRIMVEVVIKLIKIYKKPVNVKIPLTVTEAEFDGVGHIFLLLCNIGERSKVSYFE